MMLINNIYTFSSSNRLGQVKKEKEKVMEKVSSGFKINRAADNAAGLSISESFKAQVRGLSQAERNIQDGISLLQVADGALDDITKHIHRMSELSVRAANGTLEDNDRKSLNDEFQQLKKSIEDIVNKTDFNGIKLLDEDKTLTLQIKDNPYTTMGIKLYSVTTDSLNIKDVDILSSENGEKAISYMKEALTKVNDIRTEIGSYSNNLQHALMDTSNANINITKSLSVIKDLDMASSVMGMVKDDVMSKYSEMMYSVTKGNIESIKNLIQ
ncbi:flagellin [Clostridium tetanomorphum]|uniref:flagellin n=2 Tax=Clostridium tetanomorphum TaxID=1553 RepID=UPI000A1018FE|nr:flagellin [Clostridium tetanomorphum]MBP1866177.1 flagellin [Clostridium tetanomorphum]NRS85156.1 flagellin [Clostridium tetanomorphum]SQC03139.1 flagellin [Clostridium tetanomorphum]